MLSLIVLSVATFLSDNAPKPTEADLRAAQQLLAGSWQILSYTNNGDVIGPELLRQKLVKNSEIVVGDRVVTIEIPETHERRTFVYLINPLKTPREIDLITPEQRRLLGIYKIEGDELIVCYAGREDEPRPTEFAAEAGSSRTLLRMKTLPTAGRANPPATAQPAPVAEPQPAAPAVKPAARTASLTKVVDADAARTRRPTQSELNRERDLLGGNWEIQSITDDGEEISGDLVRAKIAEDGRLRIGVRGMSMVSPRDEQKHLWAYRIDPAQTPKHVDITTRMDTVLKGIYAFKGDKLYVCLAKDENEPRPTTFDAPAGSDRMVYRMKMVEDDATPPPAAIVREAVKVSEPAPAPHLSAEEKAARREQLIRDMLVGSWQLNDSKGSLVTVFRADGSYSATRRHTRKRLFEPSVITSSGTWNYAQGVLSARVTTSTDANTLGYQYIGRLQSIGDDSMVATDNIGALVRLSKIR